MKVTLTKDVLTPANGVGRVGQTVEVSASEGRDYIKAGLATEAAEETEALPDDPKPVAPKVLTAETLKEEKKPTPKPEKP